MSIATPDSTPFGSFEGLLAPEQTMSEELARYLLQFRFAPSEIDRMNELSRKAQLNALTAEEDQALEQYIFLADMLGILQSKARQRLAQGNGARTP